MFPYSSRPRNLMLAILFSLAVSLVATHPAIAEDAEAGPRWSFSSFYDYDKDLPLNLEEKIEKDTEAYTIYHWAYDSTHDKRVTAFFLMPKGEPGPMPCYLFMHGYSGNKGDVFDAADITASAGYCALFIDAEYHGERKVAGKEMYSKLAYSSRDAMMQTVTDFRRGIDILETRPDVDATRIGFAGGSMGGILGAVLAAVEPRIKATALAVGGAEWGYLLRASVVAEALGLNKGDHPLDPKEFRRIVAPADPIHWAQLISPRPVLMLNAKHDILVNPKSNKMLFARLKPPKKIIWFDDDHALPFDIALDYILKFYGAYLRGNRNPAEMGTIITGHETEPLNMDLPPLPAPWTDMPLFDVFAYDHFLPLHASVQKGKATDQKIIDNVSFLSVHDKTISATVYKPLHPAEPFATVVYLHEYGSDKSGAANTAEKIIRDGGSLIAPDLEYHGTRAKSGFAMLSPLVFTSRDAMIQNLIDIRRTLDYAETQPYLGVGPVILIARGHISADLALMCAAVDDRISQVVMLPGNKSDATKKAFAAIHDAGKDDAFKAAMSWLNLFDFVKAPHAEHAWTVGQYHVDPDLAEQAKPGYFKHRNTLDDVLSDILSGKENTAQPDGEEF